VNADMPALVKGGMVDLKAARHPLLVKVKGAETVPLDVKFGGEHTTLVVTGPNTGGKTVALKTVGLLCLMSQAGMLIPASPDSELSVFGDIFSDIGDEQSVEQSLSTFSSHMGQIVAILALADRNTLVLLDELGAGTDPAEGAALGTAILKELHRRGCRVLVTTHHGALKVFAANTPGVVNASVEFDSDTLRPTYRLLVGRPGRSNALLVARRLGMPKEVVEAAEGAKTGGEVQLDGLIDRLEKESIIAREDRARAARELSLAREEKLRYQELVKRAESERQDVVRKAREKASGILATLRQKVQELDEIARKAPESHAAREVKADIKKAGREALELVSELKSDETAPPAAGTADINSISVGDTVRVYRYNKLGKVLEVKREKGLVVVQVDALKVTLKPEELEPAKGVKAGVPKQAAPVTFSRPEGGKGKTGGELEDGGYHGVELNIIGLRVEEAMERLDKYIDGCLVAGLRQARIIHGRGTGALRGAVREMLAGHRGVKEFRQANFDEGGDAITVVEFKD